MQFSKYLLYSKISSAENRACNKIQAILNLIDKFSKIKSFKQAKELLKNTFSIENPVLNFALGCNNTLSINETKDKYSVRIFYTNNEEKECAVYCFRK